MKLRTKAATALLAALLPAAAWALEFKSVSVPRAVLYDAPSAQAKKVYVIRQYTPLEVIVNLGDWVKVRDAGGDLAWIEAGNLGEQRTLLVRAEAAEVRATPDDSAKVVFRVGKDVALELQERVDGWARVRHRDGLSGYLRVSEVWGL